MKLEQQVFTISGHGMKYEVWIKNESTQAFTVVTKVQGERVTLIVRDIERDG